ncbi:hypothetical protein ACFQZU_12010, partial [Streptomonospora algeriensis]
LPAPSPESAEEQLPAAPASVEGLDAEAVESAGPAGDRVGNAAESVGEQAPAVNEVTEQADVSQVTEQADVSQVTEQADVSQVTGGVAEAAAGATGAVDVAEGVDTPVL